MNARKRSRLSVVKDQSRIQLDMRKLEEAVHYILSKTDFGAIKLNKTLFYADMVHYGVTGSAITGARYVKRQRGPAPAQILPAIQHLVDAQRLTQQDVSDFDLVRREFTTHGETDISVFSKEEIERLDEMIHSIDRYTAKGISDVSHTIVWTAAEMGETLPYDSFFVSYLGDMIDEDVKRVQAAIKKTEERPVAFLIALRSLG